MRGARIMRLIVILLVVGCGCAPAFDDPLPVLTVCEVMKDLQRFDGKAVIVVGRYSHTDEGSWLDAECGFQVENGGRQFSTTSISTTYVASDFDPPPQKPAGFRWDEPLLTRKLRDVAKTTKLQVVRKINYTDQWMAVLGRLETRLPRKLHVQPLRGNEGDVYTTGFGHLSTSPAQLVPAVGGFLVLSP